MSSHQSARPQSVTYLTPPEWISALGPFDLDPCAAPSPRPWPTAVRHVELPVDGLAIEWRGRVWCNPPFGAAAAAWATRMAGHGNGILLLPARTETRTWFDSVWGRAEAVCFVRGRPHFHRADGSRAPFNSGCPIALIAYGQRNADALRCAGLGQVVKAGDA